ncbi:MULTISPECIES: methyltransferase [Novosphingobium]|jgi:hypothetical protein|uniref:Methyltransferase small n=1 Tax=Novosphingobium subterraneum TaxID=48936 RepID=A0A0B8ZXZ8_9SPHN|nr:MULTISPECIES: class I SAM-dependent methyltransferase [Novosphingobium]KHS42007.1 methyltransferase small [Novosphingobium subterraneum]QOV96335.1 class I SAM-dependent methyltransferase [Novosphingobium sp. ES2-1]
MFDPTPENPLSAPDQALVALLRALKARRYVFVTPTPATHARIRAREPTRDAADLRDALGWNMPFAKDLLDPEIRDLLDAAGALDRFRDGRWKCTLRVSSLGTDLYLHSSYPTISEDAVFFGPDSYRFASLVQRELAPLALADGCHLVDIGTGSGVGAITAAQVQPGLQLTMTDINPNALRLARINACAAGIRVRSVQGETLDGVRGPIDIALANPPYMIDRKARAYRDGGDMHGGQVAYDMAVATVERLSSGGKFILYTGSAILRGQDHLREALGAMASGYDCDLRYREIDPDVFGEELETDAYAAVERIALISAVFTRHGQKARTANAR